MLASVQWLNQLLGTSSNSPTALADRLTGAGIEVEGMTREADAFANVVVGEVRKVEKIPDTDHLHRTEVWDGTVLRNVVCGAANIRELQKVALATPGARLATGTIIERRTVRQVLSDGMICSSFELGLGEESTGILVLDPAVEVGRSLADALSLDDVILHLSVTPNRPDVLSHFGLARELSALFGLPPPKIVTHLREGKLAASGEASVEIQAPDACTNYVARVVKNVNVGATPGPVQRRLKLLGQRTICNVVDATNWTLLELGHPLHAFDLDRIADRNILVRHAKAGERIVTIDGVERELVPEDLVIADASGPVAIAGIMGGLHSAVTAETKNLLLESAHFDPQTIRRTSRRLGLHTEASHRFERGADPLNLKHAVDRLTEHIVGWSKGDICRGQLSAATKEFEAKVVGIRPTRAEKVLGRAVDRKAVRSTFISLGLEPTVRPPTTNAAPQKRGRVAEALFFRIPSWRHDLLREEDLIEEILRIDGLDSVPTIMPPLGAMVTTQARMSRDPERELRTRLAAQGWMEAVSLAFSSMREVELFGSPKDRAVRVQNPLGEETSVMRASLLPGLLKAVRLNQENLPSVTDLRLFEIGRVFQWATPPDRLPHEGLSLALVARGGRFARRWNTHDAEGNYPEFDTFDMKAAVEAILRSCGAEPISVSIEARQWLFPGRGAGLSVGGHNAGVFGQLHPDLMKPFGLEGPPVFVAELLLDPLLEHTQKTPRFSGLPKLPPAQRDLSFFVSTKVRADEILALILATPSGSEGMSTESVELFDVYDGEHAPAGKKSIAVSVTWRAKDRTLTEAEITTAQTRVTGALETQLSAEIRSRR